VPDVLLLDEMLPPSLAAALNKAGCDTSAISAEASLRGTPDAEVLELAAAQGRVLVTDNIRDFVPLSNAWAAQGRTHPGMLLLASKTFPMTTTRTGSIAAALLRRHHAGTWPAPGQFEFLN
jgi:hypothetical protein